MEGSYACGIAYLHVLSLLAGPLSVYQPSHGTESLSSPNLLSLALLYHRVRDKMDIRGETLAN